MVLKLNRLCEYNPHKHLQDWKKIHGWVNIKPFYFNPAQDTLYLGGLALRWMGLVWGHTGASWAAQLFVGWQHVGLDCQSRWFYTTFGPLHTWSVGVKRPKTPFREMFPSLQ